MDVVVVVGGVDGVGQFFEARAAAQHLDHIHVADAVFFSKLQRLLLGGGGR